MKVALALLIACAVSVALFVVNGTDPGRLPLGGQQDPVDAPPASVPSVSPDWMSVAPDEGETRTPAETERWVSSPDDHDAKLVGRVLNGLGGPAADLRLRATWVGAHADGSERAADHGAHLPRDGVLALKAQTSASGEYSFEGLVAGEYRIDVLRLREGERVPRSIPLGGQIASPDGRPAQFTYARPTIVVTVDYAAGEPPCTLKLYDAGAVGSPPWVRPLGYGESFPLPKPLAKLTGPGSRQPNYDGRTGTFEVEGGRQYMLVATGESYDPVPRLIRIPFEHSRLTAYVAKLDAPGTGTLEVQLTFPKCRQFGFAGPLPGTSGDFGIIIEDVGTRMPLASYRRGSRRRPLSPFKVPAGQVRIVAVGLPAHGTHHGTLISPRRFGRAEKIVEVRAGAVTEATLELSASGGFLEVMLKGDISPLDEAKAMQHIASLGEMGHRVSTGMVYWLDSGSLQLEHRARRLTMPVSRTTSIPNASASNREGDQTVYFWPLGKANRSNLIPPGTYRLRATFAERAPVEVDVTITDGETTKVELEFAD